MEDRCEYPRCFNPFATRCQNCDPTIHLKAISQIPEFIEIIIDVGGKPVQFHCTKDGTLFNVNADPCPVDYVPTD
jgi:hypothetical protein